MFIRFQQSDRQHDQYLNNHSFIRLPVRSAQCNIGTEKNPDSSVLQKYDVDNYSHGYDQSKEAFNALTKMIFFNRIYQNMISNHLNDGDNNAFFYVFDMRYQKIFERAQPNKVDFNFSENVAAGTNGYPLVLTKKLISINSDGQRHFALI